MEYLVFFQDIKKFIVNNKLDSNSHIEGASIGEIEQAIGKPIGEVPKAYVDFLKILGKNLSEEALSFDFILDSRSYDIETADEVNSIIANNPNNLIIAVAQGTFIYFINTTNPNPKVYKYPSKPDTLEVETVSELFTTFIRECAFEKAEFYRSGGEEIGELGVYWGSHMGEKSSSMYMATRKMRSDFIRQIASRELASGIISLDAYQIEWKLFFENSSLYLNNKKYYSKWGKPYVFERKSFFQKLFS